MYHRFSSETKGLREQCEYVLRYYQPLSLDSVAKSLEGEKCLPANAVTVTVDDGYRDFFHFAYPVFREYRIPVTVFLVSDFVDQKLWLWWDQVQYLFQQTSETAVAVQWPSGVLRFSLGSEAERLQASQEVIDGLLSVENSQRLDLIASTAKVLKVRSPALPPPVSEAMTWDEVREMAAEGFEFGAHTKTHPILSRIRDVTTLQEEVSGSKLRIEHELQQPVLHFCYPNGTLADFNDETLALVRRSGFRTAVTTERGMNMLNADPFLLRRIGVEPYGDTPYFRELLAGVRVQ
jgi:peptidoglycan/xylan/chitin deacetylase (PgdA/CDA1 family)